MRFLLFLLLAFGLAFSHLAHAQRSKTKLERQKRDNERRIVQANRILQDVARKKEVSLGQLSAINQQISNRQALITDISEELNLLNRDLDSNILRTGLLQQDLKKLKKEYGAMIYAAAKSRAVDKLLYIFASDDFNQFFARIQYLRQYTRARREQAEHIDKVRLTLEQEQEILRKKRNQKSALLASYTQERQKLGRLEGQQKQIVSKLSAKEGRLRAELERRQEADRRLERLIADMVRREMRRTEEARRRADRATALRERRTNRDGSTDEPEETKEAIPAASAETLKLSAGFADNKGRLGWPVESGFISGRFGKHPHPVLKKVVVENLGISLQTKGGEKVHSVFQGEVGFVADIPGVDGRIVSIMHGEYFTVYSNMREVFVKPGEKVKSREAIGTVNTDRDGVSELQFQVWRGNDRMNPESWLVGK